MFKIDENQRYKGESIHDNKMRRVYQNKNLSQLANAGNKAA
jgi:hypothetical protein